MSPAAEVLDESETDDLIPSISYEVMSYGSDMDVEGIVRRLRNGEIFVPLFQRDYVWNQSEASRFIESLLLGLPVPGVFFATDPDTNKLVVIDGQQRLKSLLFFLDGYFNPKPHARQRKVFTLTKVQSRFDGKTHADLDEKDRIRLSNAIIHATIVKQTGPPGDDSSVFHIFERLNSGGRKLTAQEIRVALYHGHLAEFVRELNEHDAWRRTFGKPNVRLKDQEMILRFCALYTESSSYSRPMSEFLNKYAKRHRNPGQAYLVDLENRFRTCTDMFDGALGKDAFRPTRAINVAVFDSTMVGLAHRLGEKSKLPSKTDVAKAYRSLLKSEGYLKATSRSTGDETFVERRLKEAIKVFSSI